MYIRLVEPYSTDIKDILELTDENSIFLSSWDKSKTILNLDEEIIEESINCRTHQNTYIMSKNMEETKKKIATQYKEKGLDINKDNITIVSNGTSAAFIAILQLLKKEISNFLFLGPIYFTYAQLMNLFQKKLFYWDVNLFDKSDIDFEKMEQELKITNIDCIIITLPLFGSGITFDIQTIKELINICNENKVYLIIDYVYGNMEWDTTEYLHNYQLIDLVMSSDYCILYESVSKRIFLNGMKSAIIYSNAQLINQINIDSEVCQGSVSYIQESLLDNLYVPNYQRIVTSSVKNTLLYARNNYSLICTLLMGTDLLISNTNSGYFTLIAIPKYYFDNKEDNDIALELHRKCGIITIPHSRYYYNLPGYYCFRINLALETEKILIGIQKLLNICAN